MFPKRWYLKKSKKLHSENKKRIAKENTKSRFFEIVTKNCPRMTKAEKQALAIIARKIIIEQMEYYAPLVGVPFARYPFTPIMWSGDPAIVKSISILALC